MPPAEQQKEFWEGVIALLVHSPALLALLGAARLSGELWLYLYFTYLTDKPKNVRYINTSWAKTAIGLVWTSPVFIVVFWLHFGFVEFDFEKSTAVILTSVVFSGMLQLSATLVTIFEVRR